MELSKLKFKLYLPVTEISLQAATSAVESDTYPVICLIHILTYFVYTGIPVLAATSLTCYISEISQWFDVHLQCLKSARVRF